MVCQLFILYTLFYLGSDVFCLIYTIPYNKRTYYTSPLNKRTYNIISLVTIYDNTPNTG